MHLPGSRGSGRGTPGRGRSYARGKSSRERNAPASWNTLFVGANAVADSMAQKLDVQKREIVGGASPAVRLALAETQMVRETRELFDANGVRIDALSRPGGKRSDTILLVKNLPCGVKKAQLRELFTNCGADTRKVLLPPEGGISAIVELADRAQAKRAFQQLTYTKIANQPIYLEWAPADVFGDDNTHPQQAPVTAPVVDNTPKPGMSDTKILVRNVPFQAVSYEVAYIFSAFGELRKVRMPKKVGTFKIEDPSMHRGFAFVEFVAKGDARRAFDALCYSTHLYGRRLVLEWAKAEETVGELMAKSSKRLRTPKLDEGPMSKKRLRAALLKGDENSSRKESKHAGSDEDGYYE